MKTVPDCGGEYTRRGALRNEKGTGGGEFTCGAGQVKLQVKMIAPVPRGALLRVRPSVPSE
jgi:hypothetical protein